MSEYNEEISVAAFKTIWNTVIEKLIDKYKRECFYINVRKDAQKLIWNNYVDFKTHCRETYMITSRDLLDRHKVCACLIYSIVKSSVIGESVPKEKKDTHFSTINEDLALTTGLSLLRAFIESAVRESAKKGEINSDEMDIILQKFESGLKYPPTHHGVYRENFLAELHYAKVEGNYNILSLAHSLFLLETYTRYGD